MVTVHYDTDAAKQYPAVVCSESSYKDKDVYFVGDLHGELTPLRDIETSTGIDNDPSSTLCLGGDYVDRGEASGGVIREIFRLSQQCPYRVIPLRGDHEDGSSAMKYGHPIFLEAESNVAKRQHFSALFPIAVKFGSEVLAVHSAICAPKDERLDPMSDPESAMWCDETVRRNCFDENGKYKTTEERKWDFDHPDMTPSGQARADRENAAEKITLEVMMQQAKKLGLKYIFRAHSHQNSIVVDLKTGITIVTTMSSNQPGQEPKISRLKDGRVTQYYFSGGVLRIDTPEPLKTAWLSDTAGANRSESFNALDRLFNQPRLNPKEITDVIYEMLDSGEFSSLESKRQEAVIALEKEMYFYLNGTQRSAMKEKSEQLHRVATASMISEWKAESVSQDKRRPASFLEVDRLLKQLNEAPIPGGVSMCKLDVLYAIYDMIEKEKGIVWASLDPRKQTALIALEKNIYSSLGDTGRRLIEDRRPKALIAALREIYVICEGLKWHSLKRGKQAALAALEKHLYDSLSPEQRQQISATRSTSIQKLNHAEWREGSRVQHRHRPGSFKKLDRLLSESQPGDLKILEKICAIKADKSFSSMHEKRRAALEALEKNARAACNSAQVLRDIYILQQSSEWRSFKPERQAALITLEKDLYASLSPEQKQGMKAERSFCQEKIHDIDIVHQWRKNSSSWMRIRPKNFEKLDELLETLSQSQIQSISQYRMDVLHYMYDHILPQAGYRHSAEWAALNSKRRNAVIELEQSIYRSLTDDQRQGIDHKRNTALSRIQRASLAVKTSAGMGDEPAAPGEDVTDLRRMRRR
ncbi:MAG TPA: hypothetical protein DIC51_04710 [Coxiellaceae bacterium]|nr:hypothetical protein [Coxiellaceae bacterium]